MICKSCATSRHRIWPLMVTASLYFLAAGNCFALAVPITSAVTVSTEDTSEHILRVKNSIPSLGQSVDALSERASQQSTLCEYAGPAPHAEDISALAMS